jgi:hypothetical protein
MVVDELSYHRIYGNVFAEGFALDFEVLFNVLLRFQMLESEVL